MVTGPHGMHTMPGVPLLGYRVLYIILAWGRMVGPFSPWMFPISICPTTRLVPASTARFASLAAPLMLGLSLLVLALEPIPGKLVILTCDDSVRGHFTVVRPILLKYGFGATFLLLRGSTSRPTMLEPV